LVNQRIIADFAIVKVRFSDRVDLEMEFKPLEPVSLLYEILQR
jgi:hypothetical protein